MVVEWQERYPKGTYKVLFARPTVGSAGFCMINLATGLQICTSSIWELLKSIEGDLSANKFPQSAMQYRTWSAGYAPGRKEGAAAEDADIFEGELPPESNGPTFIIRVLYRQNATWQGTIQWIEGRQTRQYRSVNELLGLMDDAAAL